MTPKYVAMLYACDGQHDAGIFCAAGRSRPHSPPTEAPGARSPAHAACVHASLSTLSIVRFEKRWSSRHQARDSSGAVALTTRF